MKMPDELTVNGMLYRRDGLSDANRLGAHLMYDCHAFRRAKGTTVHELAADWRDEHDHPTEEDGPPNLCPIIVLAGTKELRRVGKMVHANYSFSSLEDERRQQQALTDWVEACEADPDIPRLLAEGRNCSAEIKETK